MSAPIDDRVPVRFGAIADAAPGAALLIEGAVPAAEGCPAEPFTVPSLFQAHPAGCACCAPRAPVVRALSRLFVARARGEIGFFREVVAVVSSPRGEMAVRTALQADPLASAWFRLAAAPEAGRLSAGQNRPGGHGRTGAGPTAFGGRTGGDHQT